MTALISGLSVFVNSYGVHSIAAPSVYTTAKNLVATLVLGAGALAAWSLRSRRAGSAAARFVTVARTPGAAQGTVDGVRAWGPAHWLGLAYVGVVGGGHRLRPVLRRPGRHHGHTRRLLARHPGRLGGGARRALPARARDVVERRRHRRARGRAGRHRRRCRTPRRRPGRDARPRRHLAVGGRGRRGQGPAARRGPGRHRAGADGDRVHSPSSPIWSPPARSTPCCRSTRRRSDGRCSPACCWRPTSGRG